MTRAGGSGTHREDLVANHRDLTYALLWGVFRDVSKVVRNPYEEVEVTDVNVDADLDTRVLEGRIARVEARRHGDWTGIDEGDRVRVAAGGTLPLRVHVRPTTGSDARRDSVRVDAFVPRRGKATRGRVDLAGGASRRAGDVGSFDELVRSIEGQAPGNSVGGSFHFAGRGGAGSSRIEPAETASTVRGRFTVDVRVMRG